MKEASKEAFSFLVGSGGGFTRPLTHPPTRVGIPSKAGRREAGRRDSPWRSLAAEKQAAEGTATGGQASRWRVRAGSEGLLQWL